MPALPHAPPDLRTHSAGCMSQVSLVPACRLEAEEPPSPAAPPLACHRLLQRLPAAPAAAHGQALTRRAGGQGGAARCARQAVWPGSSLAGQGLRHEEAEVEAGGAAEEELRWPASQTLGSVCIAVEGEQGSGWCQGGRQWVGTLAHSARPAPHVNTCVHPVQLTTTRIGTVIVHRRNSPQIVLPKLPLCLCVACLPAATAPCACAFSPPACFGERAAQFI